MSASNPRPTCERHKDSDDRPTCTRDTHVREHPRPTGRAPTTATARREHDRRAAISGVLGGDWGAETGLEVDLAAATLEVVCPVHGIVHSEK